jgi:hypothetical protein
MTNRRLTSTLMTATTATIISLNLYLLYSAVAGVL